MIFREPKVQQELKELMEPKVQQDLKLRHKHLL